MRTDETERKWRKPEIPEHRWATWKNWQKLDGDSKGESENDGIRAMGQSGRVLEKEGERQDWLNAPRIGNITHTELQAEEVLLIIVMKNEK